MVLVWQALAGFERGPREVRKNRWAARVAILAPLLTLCLFAAYYNSVSSKHGNVVNESRVLSENDDRPNTCADLEIPSLQILILIIGVFYTFCGLAIVCDEYFVPALEVMAEHFQMKDDVAGATLMVRLLLNRSLVNQSNYNHRSPSL